MTTPQQPQPVAVTVSRDVKPGDTVAVFNAAGKEVGRIRVETRCRVRWHSETGHSVLVTREDHGAGEQGSLADD